MLSYLVSKLNKLTENRKERLNRNKKKPYLALSAKTAHPSPAGPEGHGGLLPQRAPPSCSMECHRASWSRHVAAGGFQASSWPHLAPARTWSRRDPILPLQCFILLLSHPFPSPPEKPPEHRSASAWLSTPRNPAKLSSVFAILDCVAVQRELTRGAPELSRPSSSSTPAAANRV